MKSSSVLNCFKYICFGSIILFTAILFARESNARTFCIINAEFLQQNDTIKIEQYLIKVTANANNEYGYDIYVEQRLFIHQPTIPALAGNSGFATKAAAEKVARKVVEKMQKGESLPAISLEELKQLGVLPNTAHVN